MTCISVMIGTADRAFMSSLQNRCLIGDLAAGCTISRPDESEIKSRGRQDFGSRVQRIDVLNGANREHLFARAIQIFPHEARRTNALPCHARRLRFLASYLIVGN